MQRIVDINATFKDLKDTGVRYLYIAIQVTFLGCEKTKQRKF